LTELADWLVRTEQIPFRTAHQMVRRVARELRRQPARRLGESFAQRISFLLEQASRGLLGDPIRVSPAQIRQTLDPLHFVKVRRVFGGPAPDVLGRSIRRHVRLTAKHQSWIARTTERLCQYPHRLSHL
jgi:argininosuccinate lyase